MLDRASRGWFGRPGQHAGGEESVLPGVGTPGDHWGGAVQPGIGPESAEAVSSDIVPSLPGPTELLAPAARSTSLMTSHSRVQKRHNTGLRRGVMPAAWACLITGGSRSYSARNTWGVPESPGVRAKGWRYRSPGGRAPYRTGERGGGGGGGVQGISVLPGLGVGAGRVGGLGGRSGVGGAGRVGPLS